MHTHTHDQQEAMVCGVEGTSVVLGLQRTNAQGLHTHICIYMHTHTHDQQEAMVCGVEGTSVVLGLQRTNAQGLLYLSHVSLERVPRKADAPKTIVMVRMHVRVSMCHACMCMCA
jgi:hypothetical protein